MQETRVNRSLHVAVHGSGTSAVHVAAVGELDMASAPLLETALQAELAAGPALLTVDLGAVSFCSVAGVSVLLAAGRRARASQVVLELRCCSPAVLRTVQVTGVTSELGLPPRR